MQIAYSNGVIFYKPIEDILYNNKSYESYRSFFMQYMTGDFNCQTIVALPKSCAPYMSVEHPYSPEIIVDLDSANLDTDIYRRLTALDKDFLDDRTKFLYRTFYFIITPFFNT